jgi:hypothetical protein
MDSPFVTIVSGLPRSGTSMMMKMLDEGGMPALTDNVRQADEDNPQGYYEFEPVKRTRQDPSWLQGAPGKAVKLVHLLLLDLPAGYEYRVLFMRRRLEEVIKSQNVMLERRGKSATDLREEQMMGLFRQQIQQVEQYMNTHANFSFLEVDYNQLLAEPQPWIEKINAFLGHRLDAGRMLAVVNPSLYRQRSGK